MLLSALEFFIKPPSGPETGPVRSRRLTAIERVCFKMSNLSLVCQSSTQWLKYHPKLEKWCFKNVKKLNSHVPESEKMPKNGKFEWFIKYESIEIILTPGIRSMNFFEILFIGVKPPWNFYRPRCRHEYK